MNKKNKASNKYSDTTQKNKDRQIAIEQNISPLRNGMRASNKCSMSKDNDIGQHVIPTNIHGPYESNRDTISVLSHDEIGSDTYTRKEEN